MSTFDGLPTRQKLHMLTDLIDLPSGLHEILNDLKQIYTLELNILSASLLSIICSSSKVWLQIICSNSVKRTDLLTSLSS